MNTPTEPDAASPVAQRASGSSRLLVRAMPWLAAVLVLVGMPALVFLIQARQSGLSLGEQWSQLCRRAGPRHAKAETAPGRRQTGPLIPFLEPVAIGTEVTNPPRVAFVTLSDLDRDGRVDVLLCDALENRIGWIRRAGPGEWEEQTIPHETPAPAHVQPYDIDGDGDLDLLVACMGMLFPNNDRVGSVVVLENRGDQTFAKHAIVERIARVTDVRGGDLDGDGDIDLVAGQFGYDDGEIRWIENTGGWTFTSHILLRLSGTVHTPVADLDADGDLDIVALVTQEWEETYVFENDGRGGFRSHLVYGCPNEDYGSSGIDLVDLDGDKDLDVLYSNGDAFDYIPPRPRPWHGVQWLENKGGFAFDFHRLGDFPGASVARAADMDRDGDQDIIVCSGYNTWEREDAYSLAWFENTGGRRFVFRNIARQPTHLIALEVGDLDGDGWLDVVTGGLHVYPPYDRMGRVTAWMNRWTAVSSAAPSGRGGDAATRGVPAGGGL